jgi:isopenicillin-N epimerase
VAHLGASRHHATSSTTTHRIDVPTPRREFLSATVTGLAALTAVPRLLPQADQRLSALLDSWSEASPEALADDERFWKEVRRAFDAPAGVINLDHGNINPSPRTVIEDLVRHAGAAERFPAKEIYQLYEDVTEKEVRPGLARLLGVPPDEIALVRNATEALDTVLLGVPLKAGDEVVCSSHDYFAMLDALEQRKARDGVVLRMVHPPIPASANALVELYAQAITPQTRLVLVTHPSNLTGQLLPVRRIADLAHAVGAELVVDGAQSMTIVEYTIPELGCDFFGASLHKWLMAPVGAGVLWMRKERAETVWPLVPPPATVRGLKRFVWSGTYPEFVCAAAAPALAFHQRLGTARKAARMRYLTRYWRERASALPGIRFCTDTKPESSCGLASFQIDGLEPGKLRTWLWERHRIFTQAMSTRRAPEANGLRISPNVYTSTAELETFVSRLGEAIGSGIG